jgi:hypothetical protein
MHGAAVSRKPPLATKARAKGNEREESKLWSERQAEHTELGSLKKRCFMRRKQTLWEDMYSLPTLSFGLWTALKPATLNRNRLSAVQAR